MRTVKYHMSTQYEYTVLYEYNNMLIMIMNDIGTYCKRTSPHIPPHLN